MFGAACERIGARTLNADAPTRHIIATTVDVRIMVFLGDEWRQKNRLFLVNLINVTLESY